jgi:mono/diheme cytochrome c family protein
MRLLILFLSLMVYFVSCTGNNSSETTKLSGQEIYGKRCAICHGEQGNAGVSGAKDLSASTIDDNLMRTIITHGKGTMPPFKSVLSQQEIEELIAYVKTLRK